MISILNVLTEFNEIKSDSKVLNIIKNADEDSMDKATTSTMKHIARSKAMPAGMAAALDKTSQSVGGIAGAVGRPQQKDVPSTGEQIKQRKESIQSFNKVFGEKIL
jgi:hypothetical protein